MAKRFKVTYKDDDGSQKATKSMSIAEATETARRLRHSQANDVHVVPASQPSPLAAHETETSRLADQEQQRRQMTESGQPAADLAGAGQTWTTEQLQEDFAVVGFAAPFVVVRRKSDGKTGSLEFTHSPRVYFGWKED